VSIQQRFIRFHVAHPEVYAILCRLARKWKENGHTTCGIGMLWEIIRWNVGLKRLPHDEEEFKLSNDYRSRYARLIMANEPDLEGFFNTRELRERR
jgi:hypothetical protein